MICPIYKKSDNYRGITLINAAYKILCRQLSPHAKRFVGLYQAGFTGERVTTDQIFCLRQILEKCRKHNVLTHHISIDFKVYNTVNWLANDWIMRIIDTNVSIK